MHIHTYASTMYMYVNQVMYIHVTTYICVEGTDDKIMPRLMDFKNTSDRRAGSWHWQLMLL